MSLDNLIKSPKRSFSEIYSDSQELADALRETATSENRYYAHECAVHIEGMYHLLVETENILNELREYLLAHNTTKH